MSAHPQEKRQQQRHQLKQRVKCSDPFVSPPLAESPRASRRNDGRGVLFQTSARTRKTENLVAGRSVSLSFKALSRCN